MVGISASGNSQYPGNDMSWDLNAQSTSLCSLMIDFEKNTINPYTVFPSSEYYDWWTCPYNHSVNKHPKVASEWDYEKNYPITPKNIKPRARRKYWWICPEKGHSYSASPDNRVGRGSRCPYCYGNRKIVT
jgi:hypothetical protein